MSSSHARSPKSDYGGGHGRAGKWREIRKEKKKKKRLRACNCRTYIYVCMYDVRSIVRTHRHALLQPHRAWEAPNVSSCMSACFAAFGGELGNGLGAEGGCEGLFCGAVLYDLWVLMNICIRMVTTYVVMQVIWILYYLVFFVWYVYVLVHVQYIYTYICRVKVQMH